MRALALACAGAGAACLAAQGSALPNVVVYLADDLGVGEVNQHDTRWAVTDTPLEPAAGRAMYTPNLERLARGGLRLLRSYTSSPICGPARYSLMTGLPTGLTGVRGNTDEVSMDSSLATLPRMLKQNGYRTYMVGKWGLGSPWSAGWDRFLGFATNAEAHRVFPGFLWRGEGAVWDKDVLSASNAGASAAKCQCELNVTCALDATTGVRQNSARCRNANAEFRRQAVAFVEEHVRNGTAAPFFLYWASLAPHAGLYAPSGPEVPLQYVSPVSTLGRYAALGARGGAVRAGHLATVTYELDADVGALLDTLRRRGLEENTLVVFLSDNGPHEDARTADPRFTADYFTATMGLRGIKRSVYEGGVRSPTIVRWPGRVPAGATSAVFTAGYDLPLTVARLVGLPAQHASLAPFRGRGARSVHRALLGLPEDGSEPVRQGLALEICLSADSGCDYAFFDLRNASRALKVVRRSYQFELYDLAADPLEKRDLALTDRAAAASQLADSLALLGALALRKPFCPNSGKECPPTPKPTSRPTTRAPTRRPTTRKPTRKPSPRPTTQSPNFSVAPSPSSAAPSPAPSPAPSLAPTLEPTRAPSALTQAPSALPTAAPSLAPTVAPGTTAQPSTRRNGRA